jgi:hypothetical protein
MSDWKIVRLAAWGGLCKRSVIGINAGRDGMDGMAPFSRAAQMRCLDAASQR